MKAGNIISIAILSLGFSNLVLAEELKIEASIKYVNCFGSNDGAIDLNISGGVAPYSVTWSNGKKTEDIENLYGGTYKVTVRDAANNVLVEKFEIARPAALTLSASVDDATSEFATDGKVEANVSGGVAPYRIQLIKNNAEVDMNAVPGGFYQLVVSDKNNCSLQLAAKVDTINKENEMMGFVDSKRTGETLMTPDK